jgi:hypothetical protein
VFLQSVKVASSGDVALLLQSNRRDSSATATVLDELKV